MPKGSGVEINLGKDRIELMEFCKESAVPERLRNVTLDKSELRSLCRSPSPF